MSTDHLPERIDPDAILEALVEFRFEHDELSEAVVGRLLDSPLLRDYKPVRLPTADIPQPIRESDKDLRYQPIIELQKTDIGRVAKVGGHVFSYHVIGQYPGWAIFSQEIKETVETLAAKLHSAEFSRIGFRYINVFRPEEHHVSGLTDTSLTIKIANDSVCDSINVNYQRKFDSNHMVMVKLATPDLVAINVRPGFSLVCDIDVATKSGQHVMGQVDTLSWIEAAHTIEKKNSLGFCLRKSSKN